VTLALRGIEKSFGAVSVLRGVTLEASRGQVHALLGENGAGKSTLMRILLGIEALDRGEMLLGGAPYRPKSPRDARARGVVMVPQERTLCPDLTVAENVILGVEPGRGGLRALLDARAGRDAAARAMTLVTGSPDRIPLDAPVRDLRVADQQLVEIARALAQGGDQAAVVVLDEPTASLGREDAQRLFERVHALRDAGLVILLVTHFLSDVRAHADRYTVLRDGSVRGEGDPRTTPSERIVAEMLGRELEATRKDTEARATSGVEVSAEVLLEVKDLACSPRPRSVSLTLRRGEVFGIAGVVGSGRTETLRAIVGLDAREAGEVLLRAPRGIGLLSEDRGGEGLMLGRSIAENVTLSPRSPLFERPRDVSGEGAAWIARLGIRASGPDQAAGDLSGGNQQKVQIARLLREDYDVLLVDEPTRGIDVAAKAQVLELLRDLASKGKGVVLVSSQLDELVTTCDRIAVLRDGKLGPARAAHEWTEESLLLEAAS
jgi:ribose transport system ATP-binding protein